MRFKDFRIKEATDGGDGGFTGYAATFDRDPDAYGDVIAKGAFARTLGEWRESGKPVPLLYGHNMEDPDYNIGWAELSEDEIGLLTVGHFDGSPKAQRVRELVKEGRLYKMSFAYDVLDECEVELDGGAKANELRDLDLFEVSVVLVPANAHAEIIEAKSKPDGRKYGMTISKATGEQLAGIAESLQAIIDEAGKAKEAVAALMPDDGQGEGGGGADEGGTGEDPNEDNPGAKSGELTDKLLELIY